MREQELAEAQLGRDDFGVEEARHVQGHSIIYGLFVAVLQRGVRLLREGARAASVGRIRRTVLHVALEQLALLQLKGRILAGADGNIENGHHAGADQVGLKVLGLFNNTGEIATENCSSVRIHGRCY